MTDRVNNIIKNWNIEENEISKLHNTVWQVGENHVLKVYEDVNMIERNIKIMTILADKNIPAGIIINTKDRYTYAKDDKYCYLL